MIDLIFPDGSASASLTTASTGRDVAASIAKSLEKKAVLIKLDGELLRPGPAAAPTAAARFEILTRECPDALETIRHDASARAGRGGAGAVPRHAGHDRPGDRGRLLLRLRPRRAVQPRTTWPRSRSA